MPVALTAPQPTPPSEPPHKTWTRDECATLVSTGLIDPRRYELIEGELIRKMGKQQPHMQALMLVVEWLRAVFGGRFVAQEASIDVSPEDNPTSEPEPDAIVLSRSFLEIQGKAQPETIRLVVEVSDTTVAFDLRTKAGLYARAGIPEYWVLDLKSRRIVVHRDPRGGQYRRVVAYGEAESLSTLAAPESTVLVGSLLV